MCRGEKLMHYALMRERERERERERVNSYKSRKQTKIERDLK